MTISTPFKKTVQIKGQSEFGNFNYLSLDLIICGNEVLDAQILPSSVNKLVFDLGDSFTITKSTYIYWFELSNADHEKC
jgi:hypothetical protein